MNSFSGKKVLILGVSYPQMDAINLLHQEGAEVYGCSYSTGDPGMYLLDGFRQIDIKDVDGVASYASEIGADLVYSVGSDLSVPTVAAVSEKLGLPHFVDGKTAKICQNKAMMRESLSESPWSLPFTEVRTLDEALQFGDFPAMMKPVDSQGQRGCYKVCSTDDIKKHFDDSLSFSVCGAVILERYVEGPEISINAFVEDSKIVFALPSDRYSFENLPGGIIKEHGLPCRALGTLGQKFASEMVDDVLARLGIKNGPVYFQAKIDTNNQRPYVIEVTPRLDGCHMWNFINTYCGVNLLEASFNLLLNGTTDLPPDYSGRDGDWMLTFMCSEPGVPFDRSQYDVSDAYIEPVWYYKTGDIVRRVNGYMEKGGYRIRRIR